MKVLVTGGAGFIGSHIVDAYIAKGYKVIVIDNLSTGKKEYINPKAKFIRIDINDKKIKDIIKYEKPDIINHHAAQVSVYESIRSPYYDGYTNILGSLNILEAARNSKVKKIIFASSGGTIYGEVKDIADENHPTFPISPYGISKLTVENYLKFYYMNYGLNYVSLRYSNVYGPRQNPNTEAGVVAIFINSIIHGKKVIINGDGKYVRDYIYIDDVVNANILFTENEVCGAFNISTGVGTDVNQLFSLITKLLNVNIHPEYGPPRIGDLRRSVLSYNLAKRMCKWAPKVSLVKGIKKTIEYFKKN